MPEGEEGREEEGRADGNETAEGGGGGREGGEREGGGGGKLKGVVCCVGMFCEWVEIKSLGHRRLI